MKRLLIMAILTFLFVVPAVATDQPAAETEPQPAAETPAVEDHGDEEALVEVSLHEIFGGLSFLAQKEEPEGLCIICPLSYCRRVGVRCDYVGCPQQTCCSFSCYPDSSCTSGNPNCSYFDCGCRRILPLP